MSTPSSSLLMYSCWTKGIRATGVPLQYGLNWALARRAKLRVFNDHLECGDWRVEYHAIKVATLYSFRTTFFIPAYVLKIETASQTFHFGLNANKFWRGELPFAAQREPGRRLRYSWMSLSARIVLLGYLAYLLWQWIAGR